MRIQLFVVLAFLLISNESRAEDERSCEDPRDTISINYCIAKEVDLIETKLNTTYEQLIDTLKRMESFHKLPEGMVVKSLINSQNSWESFRIVNCEYYYSTAGGGTGAGTNLLICKKRMATERLTELSAQYDFWHHDMGY